MSGNSFGQRFKITTCGESHGIAIGVIIDGCPSCMYLSVDDIECELQKRRSGLSDITSKRIEPDRVEILSGIFEGQTTGSPILLLVYNKDANSNDYDKLKDIFRPSHADYTYLMKYKIRDYRGGGRASARETVARVAAGAVAYKYLHENFAIKIFSFVSQVGLIKANIDFNSINHINDETINGNILFCPDHDTSKKMIAYIESLGKIGDTIGGVISCVIKNVPIGTGSPVFDKLNANLAKAMMSINAAKGFSIGLGLDSLGMTGSQYNDALEFDATNSKVILKTNHDGGIVGGISNGEDIIFHVCFKPVSSIKHQQTTLNTKLEIVDITINGRHDPCVLPRAVAIVKAMAALVIIDYII